MAVARLKMKKSGSESYRLEFASEKGKIVCEVAVESQKGQKLSEEERRAAALTRARALSRAFHEAVPER